MRRIIIVISTAALSGCIQVYGPVKTVAPDSVNASVLDSGITLAAKSVQIGNRKPDEVYLATQAFFQAQGLAATVNAKDIGIIAASGNDDASGKRWLDCPGLKQTQNVQKSYRIVAQIWRAGEGANVSVEVSGAAGLVTADGNDKIKSVACASTGVFENALFQALKK